MDVPAVLAVPDRVVLPPEDEPRLDVPGESYLVMTLAVVGFLGCLIAPFHITGLALDRARNRAGLARG